MHSFWKNNKLLCALAAFALSIVLCVGYFHVYVFVFHQPLPKTQILRHQNESLRMEAQLMAREMHGYANVLDALEVKDEEIYRSIFGLNSIPSSVRDGGLQSGNRFTDLDFADREGVLRDLCYTSDLVRKKAYIQSKSYDEIELMLHSADQMATSIPAICPIVPDRSNFHISSPFGYRVHPLLGYRRFHKGVDFSIKAGNPVFATGDGVVEKVKIERRGYGRHVIINHGFGYKTLYGHCKNIIVTEGQKVRRGDQIAVSGNSGLSTGAHLHYEVIYKDRQVNPYHYYDLDMDLEQYNGMVRPVETDDQSFLHPRHRKK